VNNQPTIHIHLRRDSSILVLGEGETGLEWFPVTINRLESVLADAKTKGSVIEYSRDDAEPDPTKSVDLTFKIIASYEMPIKLLREPSFPLT
jgi:hypothetical protein